MRKDHVPFGRAHPVLELVFVILLLPALLLYLASRIIVENRDASQLDQLALEKELEYE